MCDCDDKERIQSAFDYRYLCRPVCAVNAEILGYKQLIELDMDPINRKNSFDFPVICHINPPDLTVLEPIDYDGANAVSLQDDLLYWLEKSETRQL